MATASQLEEPLQMTEAEYLVFEEQSEERHEFVNGEVFAMTGAGTPHSRICSAMQRILSNHLLDEDCDVFTSETRVRVQSKVKVSYRYPELVVICGEIQYFNKRIGTITNPLLLVEVLSQSTAVIDRNQKFDEYTQIDSLQEYIIVSQDEPRIRRFLRQDSGEWLLTEVTGKGTVLKLPSINCQVSLADVYRRVKFGQGDT